MNFYRKQLWDRPYDQIKKIVKDDIRNIAWRQISNDVWNRTFPIREAVYELILFQDLIK